MESLVAWVRVTKKRHVHVIDLDADRSPELTRRLGVRETPSLLLLARGRVVGRLDGRSTGREIEELIGANLEEEPRTDDPLDVQ
jgi:thioredoxin-like negative regulator of GroEL